MFCWDERRVGRLRPPFQPAIPPGGGDRGGLAPPVSVGCRERGVSGVAHPPRPQDLESADLAKVVTCAAFALLPRTDFPPRRPQRNNAGVVIPSFTNILRKHCCPAYKVSLEEATTSRLMHLMRRS